MVKLLWIIIIGFLLVLPVSFAIDNYNETGGSDNFYSNGEGKFGTAGLSDSFDSQTLTIGGRKHALVADLDGDGNNEIIAVDGGTIRLFENKELDLVDNFVLDANERLSNLLAFDIDGDGFTEIIIFMEESQKMQILEFNGTNFINESSFDFNDTTANDPETIIKCGGVNDCLMAYTKNIASDGVPFIKASVFSSTGFGAGTSALDTSGSGLTYCFPKIRSMAFRDFDNDGQDEYIFSEILMRGGGTVDILQIFAIDTSSGNPVLDYDIRESVNQVSDSVGCNVGAFGGRFITSPLVEDLDGGGTMEIVVGHAKGDIVSANDQKFEISAFNAVGCNADDSCLNTNFPLLQTAQGELISNVVLANVFGDTGKVDFCVAGHDDENEELDLLCSSLLTDIPFTLSQSREFKFSTDGQYNLSTAHDNLEILMHEGKYVDIDTNIEGTGLIDTSEFVNSYGVFRIEDTTFNGSIFVKTLTRIFENERGQSSVVPVDAEKFGFNDLIAISSTNIFYTDDGLSDGGANIDNVIFDPCPDGVVIKINETMDIDVIVSDTNPVGKPQDNVNVTMTIYEGDSNEQSINFTGQSGATFSSPSGFFQMNKSIVSGNILIQAFDESNPTEIDTFDKSFDVGLFGVEKGDVTCEFDLIAEAIAEEAVGIDEATLTIDATDDAVTTGIATISGFSGLAGTTVWLIIMIFVTVFLWFETARRGFSGNSALGTIAIFNSLMIVLGARLGILSASLVVILVVVAVVILGIFLGKFFMGVRQTA